MSLRPDEQRHVKRLFNPVYEPGCRFSKRVGPFF